MPKRSVHAAIALAAVVVLASATSLASDLAGPCVACHAEDGNSLSPIYPNLGGQNVAYLERQMILMRDGRPAGAR